MSDRETTRRWVEGLALNQVVHTADLREHREWLDDECERRGIDLIQVRGTDKHVVARRAAPTSDTPPPGSVLNESPLGSMMVAMTRAVIELRIAALMRGESTAADTIEQLVVLVGRAFDAGWNGGAACGAGAAVSQDGGRDA